MFTILIPTYDHQDTVHYAIESILKQTYQDFEIFVVGDGAPSRTKEIVSAIAHNDSRIRYFENSKGEGNGELHRHRSLQESKGKFIAYLGDDDLWLPHHLETLCPPLQEHDFVQTTQATVMNHEEFKFHVGDLNNAKVRQRMLSEKSNFFGPTTVAHRKDAYLKLPYGWRPKPEGMWSDLHMWRQWLSQDWVRFKSLFPVTSLHLGAAYRREMTVQERCEEMKKWSEKISEERFGQWLTHQHLANWNSRLNDTIRPGELMSLAQKYQKSGNYTLVIELVDIVLNSDANKVRAWGLKIASLLRLKEFEEADSLLQEAMDRFPTASVFYQHRFNLAMGQDNFKMAEAIALDTCEILPDKAFPYSQLSLSQEKQRNFKGAIASINMAIERNGDNPQFQRRRRRLRNLLKQQSNR